METKSRTIRDKCVCMAYDQLTDIQALLDEFKLDLEDPQESVQHSAAMAIKTLCTFFSLENGFKLWLSTMYRQMEKEQASKLIITKH